MIDKGMHTLILGGARSGKSRYAEGLALATDKEVYYFATAQAFDQEMAERIAKHQHDRPAHWHTVEEPIALADQLQAYTQQNRVLLVDCLTLWLSNCLHESCWSQQRQALLEILPSLSGDVILVSNETGLGVVPMGQITRQFVDESGWLHQALAAQCDQVSLVVAGLPMHLKTSGE